MPVCVHCNNRTFVNEEALKQHLKSSSAHPFCMTCNRHFVNEKAYEAHMTARHPPTFDCTKCNRTYRSQLSLEDHYRGSPAHPNCSRCGKGFKNKRLMEEHFSVQHSLVSCPCGPMTLYFDELDAHYLSADAHPSCQPCNLGFKDQPLYHEHLTSIHTNTYCAPCSVAFESSDALLDHYLVSPRHPTCMTCGEGFKGDQEFSSHLSSVHPGSPPCGAQRNSVANSVSAMAHLAFVHRNQGRWKDTETLPRSSIPIRRPIVRTDSPALSLCPGFGSPLMDVKAPIFCSSTLPPPGGIVDDIWAMKENTQTPIERQQAGRVDVNGFSPVLESLVQRRPERPPYTAMRDSWFLSSITAEPSPLNNQIVPEEQDSDNTQTFVQPCQEESRDLFLSEFDPIVPLERRARTGNTYQAIGSSLKDRQSNLRADAEPFVLQRPRAPSSVQSSSGSLQSSPTFHSLASPKSNTSEPNAVPFIVSSPILSSIFQPSECREVRSLDKGPELLYSAMATPIVSSPKFKPSVHASEFLSVPKYNTFSPTDSNSPDVSSPLGLVALPSISSLMATPIERTRSLNEKDNNPMLEIPETRFPLPDSPSGRTSASVDETAASDTAAAPALQVEHGGDPGHDLTVMTVKVLASTGSNPPFEAHSIDNMNIDVDSPCISESPLSGTTNATSPPSPTYEPTGQLCLGPTRSPKATLNKLASCMATPTTAVESLQGQPEISHLPVSRLLRCRLCQVAMCSDPTATMCGHLFCYKCITEAVIKTPSCPTCATPTLLYCLFRLDLSS